MITKRGSTALTAVAIIGLIIVVLVLTFRPFGGSGGTSEHTLSATGTGTINVFPDEAIVYLVVESIQPTAEQSKDEHTRITNKVLNAV